MGKDFKILGVKFHLFKNHLSHCGEDISVGFDCTTLKINYDRPMFVLLNNVDGDQHPHSTISTDGGVC
jgi:hypothetical protein